MEIIHKYDDERIYKILLAWLENNLAENIYEYSGLEELDILNIVVNEVTKSAIEGSCTILIDGEDMETEYDTEFTIIFDEDNLVIDVQLLLPVEE